jgi:MoaA/NifB/PqqE/SkfB family radical SAM enzyme
MSEKAAIVRGVLRAWQRILSGYRPNLSIEITKECPLRCPGCYAYGDDHLGGTTTLRGLADYQGDELVGRFMRLVDDRQPLNVFIVGGEPLVRYRELTSILPQLDARDIHTEVVTSAVRPIPSEWLGLRRLQLVVSIDGLPAEHDVRRAPATYDRILKHIAGHHVTVHCTVTRQQVQRDGYLEQFLRFWQANADTRMIWVSLYTPQRGEVSAERLTPIDRERVIRELRRLRPTVPKLQMFEGALQTYGRPPDSPADCTFARTTECVSADLARRIVPCQFGGDPDCSQCGCIASASLEAIARHRLMGIVPVGRIFDASQMVGRTIGSLRAVGTPPSASGGGPSTIRA